MKKALVLGAGGFIGHHLVSRLKAEGYVVIGADQKMPAFGPSKADDFRLGDLREYAFCEHLLKQAVDEVYQLAADMGGAGYLFTGENDFDVMHNSSRINLNVARAAVQHQPQQLFFSSSACVYPKRNQADPTAPNCEEASAYPADPDSEYGWEKLFSERLYQNARHNYGLNVRIARFHNVYGPGNDYATDKAKAPAAICRKVAEAEDGASIEIWGDGQQTRSFLYIEDCLDGIQALMRSQATGPLNIGSEELISLNDFARMVIRLSGKTLTLEHVDGPVGVQGRTSDNRLVTASTGWQPAFRLEEGLRETYRWVAERVSADQSIPSHRPSNA
ncbi:MAG: NAD-dependent epimerase/dehydratase family protein [Bacteroidota bacterium]